MAVYGSSCSIRALDIVKFRPHHLESVVRLQSEVAYLTSDMLAFAITIGPDVQSPCISSLSLDVVCNCLLILYSYRQHLDPERQLVNTYISDIVDDPRLE